MVKVDFYEFDNDLILEIKGHAEYKRGNDIVCAGVSALAYTLAGAIHNSDVEYEFKDNPGDFICGVKLKGHTRYTRYKIKIIFETIIQGLKQIEHSYPNNVQVSIIDNRKKDTENIDL